MANNFEDVQAFHEKFGLPRPLAPVQLDADTAKFRVNFMCEELVEFQEALRTNDLAKQADALVDLVYVAMGTVVMMGLPWQALWDEVQRANMSKVRADHADDPRSARRHSLDVVKPVGWVPPDIEGALARPVVPRPKIVCLCGSTRFKKEFVDKNYELTKQGIVVLTVGWFSHSKDVVSRPTEEEKIALDELYKRKIDLCDEVLVLNVNGYIGESTRSEIVYAEKLGRPVRYLVTLPRATS